MATSMANRPVSRRDFMKAAAAVVAAPYVITSEALGAPGRPPASERIVMGAVGVGGRGRNDLHSFLGFGEVQAVAVCDVQKKHLDAAKAEVDRKYGNKDCATYGDFRELLDRGDIDALLCATPDHWHALVTIAAMKRGIDVFCEKPLSLTIRQGRAMVNTARRYGCVFSCGSQRVMGDYGKQAQYVASGAIGRIQEVWVNVGGPSRPCNLPGMPVPDDVDWDMWLGPAPWAPYHPYRCAGAYGLGGKGWRTWRDYSGGMMTDWGGHKFGGAMYACQLDTTGPIEVIPPDGKEHELLTYVFANGIRMYHGGKGNITYKGTKGISTGPGRQTRPDPLRRYHGTGGIGGDFLYCVRHRVRPFRDVEYAHRVATVCHLGNIAYRLKRPLRWDPDKEVFIGDEEANRLLDRPMREPWRL
ncbi:MAG: Gfo/Idh/MocA family oxidoreductase [Planctomycetes bacterium]|nr:Gfo/Idh/MocA family oxidoreductase [Planctomycetota bacterium]